MKEAEGRKAREDGLHILDNPYSRNSTEADEWKTGWLLKHYELLKKAEKRPC